MATYTAEKLRAMWRAGELSVEQMMGHLFQHVEQLESEVEALKKAVHALQAERKR